MHTIQKKSDSIESHIKADSRPPTVIHSSYSKQIGKGIKARGSTKNLGVSKYIESHLK